MKSITLTIYHNQQFLFIGWERHYIILILLTALVFAIIAIAIMFFPKSKFLGKYKSEYLAQSQAIKLERQRISEELHDELGSGLSAVKLYSELTTKKYAEISEIAELNEMIHDISVKINDIIWTTSTENDQFDSVIFYIQEQLAKLFRHSHINFESILPEEIPFLRIKSESRRNFYLLAKEIAHNSLKHSHAEKISFEISLSDENITLIIKDDGQGFDPVAKEKAGMGLASINHRVARLNGNLTIENYKGTKVIVIVPISDNFYPEVIFNEDKYTFSFWKRD